MLFSFFYRVRLDLGICFFIINRIIVCSIKDRSKTLIGVKGIEVLENGDILI